MSSSETKKNLKAKIIAFVEQTQTGGPNPVSFNEFSRQNPDRKQIMEKQAALAKAIELIKSGDLRLVVDNDTQATFNYLKFHEFVDKDDKKQIIEEYSRFLSRTDILGAAYCGEQQTTLGSINFEAINKMSDYINDLGYEHKQEFVKNFNTYLVRFDFILKLYFTFRVSHIQNFKFKNFDLIG